MSTGFAALLVAGLSGGACGGHSGLKSGQDGASAAGGATGSQAGSSASSATVGASGTGGTVGTGGAVGTGGTVACPPHPCFALASCADRLVPNPDPCGCPICPPDPDAGVANDAGRADGLPTGQFPACPMLESMLESLNPTDAARVSWAPGRFSLECALANGSTENCLSNDATTCGGSVLGCINQCAADEYGWSVGGIGPGVAPSIDLPAGCRTVPPGTGGPGFTCCPCGEAAGRDAASSEVGTSLCPPDFVSEGGACPSPNLRCPGFASRPHPLCSNYGTCLCGADGIWVFEPSMCD